MKMDEQQLSEAEQKLRDEIKKLEELLHPPMPRDMIDAENAYLCKLCQSWHPQGFKCEPLPHIRF